MENIYEYIQIFRYSKEIVKHIDAIAPEAMNALRGVANEGGFLIARTKPLRAPVRIGFLPLKAVPL